MKNKILDTIMEKIKEDNKYDNKRLLEIRYGIETLYLSIFKLLIIIIISFFIHTTYYLCLLFLTYGLLRITGFGLHTKNSLQCWIFSITIFSLFPFLIKELNINTIYLYLGSIILFVLIILYAPADTEKRPLINKKKRLIYKIITSIITSIYVLIMFITNNLILKKLLFFSVLLEVILILPISYKLLGLKYNNYITYKKKGGIK